MMRLASIQLKLIVCRSSLQKPKTAEIFLAAAYPESSYNNTNGLFRFLPAPNGGWFDPLNIQDGGISAATRDYLDSELLVGPQTIVM